MVASNSSVPYQAVIGLAGHVDHGKTALIQALTGMMTARAHEQALGMTQDLGFAHFQDDSGNTIGVVDVPGHERYLRNMVAGVWHLNVLLLVIAADEGWMPMTTSHVQVAHAMGIEHIVGTVRSIQAYYQSLQTISGTCRVALNIKGVSRKDIGRGHLVVSANDTMTLADQCIIRINKNDAKLKEKKQRQVEAAIGTWHGVAKVSYLPQTQLARDGDERVILKIWQS